MARRAVVIWLEMVAPVPSPDIRRAVVTWAEMVAPVPSPDIRRAVVTWVEMVAPMPEGAYTARNNRLTLLGVS